jgi:hypothetical protein
LPKQASAAGEKGEAEQSVGIGVLRMSDEKESKGLGVIRTVMGIAAIALVFALPRRKSVPAKQNDKESENGGDDLQEVSDKHHGEPPLPLAANKKCEGGNQNCKPCQCERHSEPPVSGWTKFSAVSQALFSFFLVGVGIFQVLVYMDQASVMRIQANIAQNQLNEQRAFINVSELRQEDIVDSDGSRSWIYTPVITNSGNTPAMNVSLIAITPHTEMQGMPFGTDRRKYAFLSWKIHAPNDPDDIAAKNDEADVFRLANVTIGPKGTLTASQISEKIFERDPVEGATGEMGRFFFGSIHYIDISGNSHVSKYCFRIDRVSMEGVSAGKPIIQRGQDLCTHWNCTDQYCHADKTAYEADVAKALPEYRGGGPAP